MSKYRIFQCAKIRQRKKSAMTLLEVLMTIVLLAAIGVSLGHFMYFTVVNTIASDMRAKLQNEASYVLEHMSKNLVGFDAGGGAIGYWDPDNNNGWAVMSIVESGNIVGIRARVDRDANTGASNGRIDANDRWIAYRLEDDRSIGFYDNCGSTEALADPEVLARHVLDFQVLPAASFDVNGWLNDDNFEVVITERWYPAQLQSPQNPEVVMRNRIKMPGVSLAPRTP